MPIALSSLFEQTWHMASETVSVSVNDQAGTNTRTITDTGAWYRTRLVASGSTSGTIDSPHSLCAKFQAALNAGGSRYLVRYQSDGRIGITYTGTGTSTITWGTNGAKLRRMLGFAESATTATAQNATSVGTYHPCGSVLTGALLDGSGWITEPAGVASAVGADGRVYTASSQASVTRFGSTLGYHPTTWAAWTELSEYSTPIFAGTISSIPALSSLQAYYQPWTSCASSGGGIWSVHAFVSTAIYSVALCLLDFNSIRTTTSSNVIVGWLTPETLARAAPQSRPIANYLKRANWQGLEMTATSNISVAAP